MSSYYYSKNMRQVKLGNSTYDICTPFDLGRNLTLTTRGRLNVILGDWFRPKEKVETLVNSTTLHNIFKLKVESKQ